MAVIHIYWGRVSRGDLEQMEYTAKILLSLAQSLLRDVAQNTGGHANVE